MKKRQFEDYEEMALYLRTAIRLLHHVSVTYKRAAFSGQMEPIGRRLTKIRSDLEAEMYRDYPERSNTNLFYGGGDYVLDIQEQKDSIRASFRSDTETRGSQGGETE